MSCLAANDLSAETVHLRDKLLTLRRVMNRLA